MAATGFDIAVVSVGGTAIANVPTTIFPYTGRSAYVRNYRSVMQRMHRLQPDLVHIHAMSGHSLWALGLGRQPYVASIWGSDIVETAQTEFGRWLIGRGLRRASRITATSGFLREQCTALYPDLAEKVQVIPFGVDIPDAVPSFPPLPPDGPLRLLILKADRPLYGAAEAIEAVAAARNSGADVTLTILSPDQQWGTLENHVTRHHLSAHVRLLGQIPHEKIAACIAEHHLLLRPSKADAFGVAILEAAVLGRPSIASRVGGIPEVLQDGKGGMLVPAGDISALTDAILQIAYTPMLVRQMGSAAREFVTQHFQWKDSLSRMAALYREVLTEQTGRES